MFGGAANHDGLHTWLLDHAPYGDARVMRAVVLRNASASRREVEVILRIAPARPHRIAWIENRGVDATASGDGALRLASRHGPFAFTVVADMDAVAEQQTNDTWSLTARAVSLAPDESAMVSFRFLGHAAELDPREARRRACLGDAENLLATTLIEWRRWQSAGVPLNAIESGRVRDLLDGAAAQLRMQQGASGGFLATPRTYEISFLRDCYGAVRGLLALGHTEEVRRFLEWVDGNYRELQPQGLFPIPNAAGVGLPSYFAGKGQRENWCAETPALYLLAAHGYLKATGDVATLHRFAESLRFAMDVQLEEAARHDGRLPFNTDETEFWGDRTSPDSKWSLNSAVLCSASLEFYLTFLEAVGAPAAELASYRARRVEVRHNIDRHFWDEALGRYLWRLGEHGERMAEPQHANFQLMPVFYGSPVQAPARAARTALAIRSFFNAEGYVPLVGGARGRFTGHGLGYLLYALTILDDPLRDQVFAALVEGPTVGCWGTWGEYYTEAREPETDNANRRERNNRVFETGVNVDAIVTYLARRNGAKPSP